MDPELLPELDPRLTKLPPLWEEFLDRATGFLDESINVQSKTKKPRK